MVQAIEDPKQVEEFITQGQQLFRWMRELATTVAAIRGDCIGGALELAINCDKIVVADTKTISEQLIRINYGP